MDCVCCRDTRRKRWLKSQNSSCKCIRRKHLWHRQEEREEGAGVGDKMFTVRWSPALIHKWLSSAENDTVLCFYVKLSKPSKTLQLPEGLNWLSIICILTIFLVSVSYHFCITSHPLGFRVGHMQDCLIMWWLHIWILYKSMNIIIEVRQENFI